MRAYRIILDGKQISEITQGETKELSIPPGKHDLSIRIDWTGSKTLQFTSSDDEAVTFRVRSNLRWTRFLLATGYIFSRDSYLFLELVS